jgi:hypothetical protein
MAFMYLWLLLLTAIASAGLVTNLMVLSRLPRRQQAYPPPQYPQQPPPPQQTAPPPAYGWPQSAPPTIDPQATTWVPGSPGSRCAELNITD